MIKKYVLGFAFSRNKNEIALILKDRPEWQKGKINGIGGKVEPEDFDITSAMVREFKEETGVDTILDMWNHFATMIFKNDIMGGEAHVYCFRMFSNVIYQCQTVEEEEIKLFSVDELNKKSLPIIEHLKILVPLALEEDFTFTELNSSF